MFIQNFINHLEKVRRYSSRTVNSYRQNLGYLCDYLASVNLSIDNVSTKQLSGYIMYCMERGLQPKSINQHLASIRSYFDYCCRFEDVKNNPAAGLRDVRTPKTLPRFISEEKMSLLIDHLLPCDTFKQIRARIVVLLFYHTGIRCNELATLTYSHVNLSGDFIKVRGKGDKERYIPFGQELHDELIRYFKACPEGSLQGSEGIIKTIWGGACTPFQIRRICKVALLKIVPAELAHPHILRHSFATALMNHGARIENVRLLLGHASCDTTAIYQHVSINYLRTSYSKTFER